MKAKSRASARAAACVLAGLAVLAPCPADAQQTVSLDEAVERALVRSPQMLQQDQAVDNAALGERSAWAAFLPNLSMNTSGSLRSANDSRLAARQEADAALYNLRTAARAIEIAQEAELVAGEDLRVVRERYSVGVATILDVLISQNAADQASVDVVTSRYDYVLARAELESILGRVL